MIDVTANNIANANTLGFKRALLQVEAQPSREVYRFQTDPGKMPLNRLDGVPSQELVGNLGNGARIFDTPTNFEQGSISLTGNDLNFALYGSGFFAVRDAQGVVRYTRDGSFLRSSNNLLATVEGDTVLDPQLQPIALPAIGKIMAESNGVLSVNSVPFGKLGVFQFRNLNALRSQGANSFIDGNAAGVVPDVNTAVFQGAQEKSNFDIVRGIVDLITAQRWFDANQKVIQSQDDATGIAISQVGRTQR
jgi:flagellar basal-body rod protein FlgF